MLQPRVHTPAGDKSRNSLLPPPGPQRKSASCDPSGRVRVVARVRPFQPSEVQSHAKSDSCVSISKDHAEETTLHIKDSTTSREGYYKVDSCYDEKENVNIMFQKEVEPLLPGLFQGNNATVFAYGATGSGKTYTMQGSDSHPGLMLLAMSCILEMSARTSFQVAVAVAYYEIYMDRCYDLLDSKATEIAVLEGNNGRIQLRGLSQVSVRTMDEFREVFVNGCLRRRVGHTGLNDVSSRSHGVLTVTLTSESSGTIHGKLNLIDLAGNEDNRRTGNEGPRLAESARINQDLFALSNVISALSSNETRVPYRDSKLTRILQDSLGGTSRAVMIVCLNPRSYLEAAHTLIIAARTRQIMNQTHEKKANSPQKVDMGAKLRLWLEAKGKVTLVSPSPVKAKPLFYTPSHRQMNQARRLAANLPQDTPKARRTLICHHSNSDHEKKYVSATPAQALAQAPSSIQLPIASSDQSTYSEQQIQVVNGPDSGERIFMMGLQSNKENVCDVLDYTPCNKALTKTSSPPLSERLHKLRTAMAEILQPSNTIMTTTPVNPLPELKTPASVLVVGSSPGLAQKYSPSNSPAKTPCPLAILDDGNHGTPLEKLGKRSSGIKKSMTKELLDFFNTASREELLELKGIGEKRAAYILSLRRESPEPLKEIEDLEKIGISRRQAQTLFKGTARHILFA